MVIKKKNGGRVFGAVLTKAEKRAMDIEISKQLAEYDRKHSVEIDAIVLWILHDSFGFGSKRLRRFYEEFTGGINKLIERYNMDDIDRVWICTHMLKEHGIDIEKWYTEMSEQSG